MIPKKPKKYPKTLVVRITANQYERLLETIIRNNNRSKKIDQNEPNQIDKSKVLREMIDKYTVQKIS